MLIDPETAAGDSSTSATTQAAAVSLIFLLKTNDTHCPMVQETEASTCSAVVVLLPFLGIGVCYVWYSINACTVVVRMPEIARAGLQFQITETYCSTLGEDAAISVFGVSQPGGSRTLLFKYGPESDEVPLPRIDVSDEAITMTVPVVSDTSFQIGTWRGRRVVYEIGRIRYPPPASGGR